MQGQDSTIAPDVAGAAQPAGDNPYAAVPATQVPDGQEPKASPAVRVWAVLLGLALIALAAVAGREVWRLVAAPEATSWTQPFIDLMATDGLRTWMPWAGAAAIVVGLVFLGIAAKPRRRTHQRLSTSAGSAWVRHVDIARRCSAVARRVPGVAAARTQSSSSGIAIIVNGDVNDSELSQRVIQAVTAEMDALETPTKVTVTVEPVQEVDARV